LSEPTKLFSINVRLVATAYILAQSEEEAMAAARDLTDSSGEMPTGYFGDGIEISGESYNPDMPELSFSPAMTVVGPIEGETPELVTEWAEIDCGQCEGTGTTDAMGHDEECPVCDGSGKIVEEVE
jgi:DnaJ-class molecular chaperone